MLNLLLPGTPNIYYGEELGMSNIDVQYEDILDPWGKNNPVSGFVDIMLFYLLQKKI